jgi:hypothetical protein
MSNKNPFEIRAEMVQLAKEYMDKQQEISVQFAKDMFEQGKMQTKQFQEACQMYSVEDMMKKAQEMYSFVSKKD